MKPRFSLDLHIVSILVACCMAITLMNGSSEAASASFQSMAGFSSPSSKSQASPSLMKPLGHFSGAAYSAAVRENFLYSGIGQELAIFDLLPWDKPRLGSIMLSAPAREIAVEGDFAFLAEGDGGLAVIDISHPARPRQISSYQTTSPVQAVAVYERHAYLAAGAAGLRVLDISNPAQPVETGSYSFPQPVNDVVGGKRFVYVAAGSFYIVDTWVPGPAGIVGIYSTTEKIQNMAVQNSIAYLAVGKENLHIVDVDIPTEPIQLSVYSPDLYPQTVLYHNEGVYHVAISGDIAYISLMECSPVETCYLNDLVAIKVKDPRQPSIVPGSQSRAGYPDDIQSLILIETTAYIAQATNGLQQVDITGGKPVQQIGVVGSVKFIQPELNYAYVRFSTGWDNYLRIFDTHNLVNPYSDQADATEMVYPFIYAAGYLYNLNFGSSLKVMKLSNSNYPIFVKEVPLTEDYPMVWSLSSQGNYLYAILSNYAPYTAYRLEIMDISDPAAPVDVGFYVLNDTLWNIAVSGNYAYLATGKLGVQILDISNPASPSLAGSFPTPDSSTVYDAAVMGSYAYIACGSRGLRVLDISIPSNPRELGFADQLGDVRLVEQTNNIALVANQAGELWQVDVSDPAQPEPQSYYPTYGQINSIAPSGTYAYIGGVNGFYTFQVLSFPYNVYLPIVFR